MTCFLRHVRGASRQPSRVTASFIEAAEPNPETVMILGLAAVSLSNASKLSANLVGIYTQMEIFDNALS